MKPGSKKPHPIVDLVFAHLESTPAGSKEKLRLKDAVRGALQAAFGAMKTNQEKEEALIELVVFGEFLIMSGAPTIVEVLKNILAPLFGGVVSSDASSQRAQKALQFLGLDKAAPPAAAGEAGQGKKWWELEKPPR
jgi:hypothetical protein